MRKCVKMRREGKACLVRPAEDTGLGKAGRGTSGKRWGPQCVPGVWMFAFDSGAQGSHWRAVSEDGMI